MLFIHHSDQQTIIDSEHAIHNSDQQTILDSEDAFHDIFSIVKAAHDINDLTTAYSNELATIKSATKVTHNTDK